MIFAHHVAKLVQSCFLLLRNVPKFKFILSSASLKQSRHTLIFSSVQLLLLFVHSMLLIFPNTFILWSLKTIVAPPVSSRFSSIFAAPVPDWTNFHWVYRGASPSVATSGAENEAKKFKKRSSCEQHWGWILCRIIFLNILRLKAFNTFNDS